MGAEAGRTVLPHDCLIGNTSDVDYRNDLSMDPDPDPDGCAGYDRFRSETGSLIFQSYLIYHCIVLYYIILYYIILYYIILYYIILYYIILY